MIQFELSKERWERWRNYLDSGNPEKVINEYDRLMKLQERTFGDSKLRQEALDQLGVLSFSRYKHKNKHV